MDVKNSISLKDNMTPAFNKMLKAMESTLKVMKSVDKQSNEMFEEAKKDINEASSELEKFNKRLNETGKGGANLKSFNFNNMVSGIRNSIDLLDMAFDKLKRITDITDEFNLMTSRITLINDGLQTTGDLQNSIYEAANRSRGSYQNMAAVVSKLGLLASDAFSSSQEIIDFAEILNKSFIVSGAGTQEQQAAMLQLTQSMASGKLQGDEFKSMTENAPMLIQAIADYLNVSKGAIKELSSEGKITSDVIKNAMFAAADDINAKFETMPKTFGSVMQEGANKLLFKFYPVINAMTQAASSFFRFLFDNLDMLDYIFTFIGTVALGLLIKNLPVIITQIASMAVAAWAAVAPWLAMNWPIVLIAAGVTALLALFLKFPEVFGVVTGGFNALGTGFMNVLKWMYNGVVSFLNGVIDLVNKIPGVNIDKLEKLEYGDIGEAYSSGYEGGTAFAKSIKQGIDDISNKFFGNQLTSSYGSGMSFNGPTGTESDPISVKGTVSISGEDIKMLKDVAKAEYINRYMTVKPTVNASFGDVRETADVNAIAGVIADMIEEAEASSLVG